jgi:hypothetical protein
VVRSVICVCGGPAADRLAIRDWARRDEDVRIAVNIGDVDCEHRAQLSVVVLAAGLGALAGHEHGRVPEANRWVLCAGAALFFFTATALGARSNATRRWILGWGLPALAAPLLLGVLGGPLPAWALAAALLAAALWHVAYRRVDPLPAA